MTTRIRRATPADVRDIATVHVRGWQETYPGMLPQGVLDRMETESTARFWRAALSTPDGGEIWVAEGDGRVAGFGVCGREKVGLVGYRGEFQALYVLSWAQGRGLGSGLMGAMADSLREKRLVPATVWTLRDNWRARAFYEKLGGRRVADRPLDFDGTIVMEVAYAWNELSTLTRRGAGEG